MPRSSDLAPIVLSTFYVRLKGQLPLTFERKTSVFVPLLGLKASAHAAAAAHYSDCNRSRLHSGGAFAPALRRLWLGQSPVLRQSATLRPLLSRSRRRPLPPLALAPSPSPAEDRSRRWPAPVPSPPPLPLPPRTPVALLLACVPGRLANASDASPGGAAPAIFDARGHGAVAVSPPPCSTGGADGFFAATSIAIENVTRACGDCMPNDARDVAPTAHRSRGPSGVAGGLVTHR
jgi:hypothetical protein